LEDFRKAREETALDIFCSLQTRYPDWTVTMTPGSTGLKAFADASQATAKLDVESENLLSQLKVRTLRSHFPPQAVHDSVV
jgi:hypothetical protein